MARELALPSGYRMKFICDACFQGTGERGEGLKTTKNGHFISPGFGSLERLVTSPPKVQLFKEFAVHKERCKVTPGPP